MRMKGLDDVITNVSRNQDVVVALNELKHKADDVLPDWRIVFKAIRKAVNAWNRDARSNGGAFLTMRQFTAGCGSLVDACTTANMYRSAEKVVGYKAGTNTVQLVCHAMCHDQADKEACAHAILGAAADQFRGNSICSLTPAALGIAVHMTRAKRVHDGSERIDLDSVCLWKFGYASMCEAYPMYGRHMRMVYVDTKALASIPCGTYNRRGIWEVDGASDAHVLLAMRDVGGGKQRFLDVSCAQFAPGVERFAWRDNLARVAHRGRRSKVDMVGMWHSMCEGLGTR